MKMKISLIIFCLLTVFINGESIWENATIIEEIFNVNHFTKSRVVFDFTPPNSRGLVASVVLDSRGFAELIYESSGYYINLSDIKIEDSYFTISFIKIWRGAEETNIGDRRKLYKYVVTVTKDDITDKNAWLIQIPNVTPVLKIEDSYNSVIKGDTFTVKKTTSVMETTSETSKALFVLEPTQSFDIIDAVEDSNVGNYFWLKIKYDDIVGYIPLDSLSDNWVVLENNLTKTVSTNGTINDSRVRVRSEPNLKCETLDYVNKGDSVKILDRSTDKQQIGDMNDYWYNVELQNGTKGWVYGAYIDSL
ncbi:SH3 domain-containing protein [Treponema brennaborense]|uniref:SH3 type 3 domain protein n=1 Tax=Treponema brennaborense (strain DSM 12168 / CIP 105900 / DD5/3) TaxID=906968 RepID=F4LJF0_TREBD|nr:SH3 domain-containing protein [Treponema brennaborense]AEE17395.1 SH3 type 3 domain protein [Treponema brennaborense DSM 12168]